MIKKYLKKDLLKLKMLTGGNQKSAKKDIKKVKNTDSDKDNKEKKSKSKKQPEETKEPTPEKAPTGVVVKVEDVDTYNRYKSKGLVIIDYYTTWCNPCRLFAPEFENIAKKYPGTVFLSVNAEKLDHEDCNKISGVPHFKIILNGVVKREFSGADPDRLIKYIERYYVQIYINGTIQRTMDKETKQKIINYVNSFAESGPSEDRIRDEGRDEEEEERE